MDRLRSFVQGLFGFQSDSGSRVDGYYGDESQHGRQPDHSDKNSEEYVVKQFSGVPDFDRGFEEMRRHMDETFDEVFKLFGANNIPFFDPYIPPHDESNQDSKDFHSDQNVRNHMFRGQGRLVPEEREDRNVRKQMLTPSSSHKRQTDDRNNRQDINWDSLIKQGGDLHDILDHENTTDDGQTATPSPRVSSVYRYSSVTSRRMPDGTIETRRVTRDEKGNESETVEVTRGSGSGDSGRDADLRSRFLQDRGDLADVDWVKKFFRQ